MGAIFGTEFAESPRRIRLVGELDLAFAHEATEKILESGCNVVDCSDLTFLDSSGLSALNKAHKEIEARGEQLVFTGFVGSPLLVLEVTGLNEILHLG